MSQFINRWDAFFGYKRPDPIKRVLKTLASFLPIELLRRVEPYALISSEFSALKGTPSYVNRSDIWDKALTLVGPNQLTYLLFGVYQGESIFYFASNNIDKNSLFMGLDSFEGLPEAWAGNPKGFFSTLGKTPETIDSRVQFVSGWFIDSWNKLDFSDVLFDSLIVHFDADLYSSTLFALSSVDGLGHEYFAIFDEFSGQEASALSDYLAAYGAKVDFIAKQEWRGYPEVVLCKIKPHKLGM